LLQQKPFTFCINMSRMNLSNAAWMVGIMAVGTAVSLWVYPRKLKRQPGDMTEDLPVLEIACPDENDETENTTNHQRQRILKRGMVTIVHGSMTGTCFQLALQLMNALTSSSFSEKNVQMGPITDWDWWDELSNDDDEEESNAGRATLIVLLPTYTDGTWSPLSMPLQEALQELQTDWRIAKSPLKEKLQVAVFGTGSSEYDSIVAGAARKVTSNMGQPAKEATQSFRQLGAKVVVRCLIGDDAVGNHVHDTFEEWKGYLLQRLSPPSAKSVQIKISTSTDCACRSTEDPSKMTQPPSTGCCQASKDGPVVAASESTNHVCCSTNNVENQVDDLDFDEEDDAPSDDEDDAGEPEVMDLEDIGEALVATAAATQSSGEPREMVTPSQARALKKEGYKLIGTHSAVKLCRWTKHQLRGRGGCYKHTFYGITSYQCMEATPSLACANKCVFCWRHHKNPVGKEWRWKTDDPYYIVEEAVQTHIKMIKETRGIPGVQLDRWKEAHTVRHCALSLVGEPIMYPRIDELLGELHRRKISTFLVTNGQHPAAIGSIRPITQLYVSVDAPTEQSLIAIDRPLFQDAWDRLRWSLASLKDKGQRTVARLTVVKGWNFDEIAGYAELIALGQVSLVEVKGVTFCGKSDASNLNMTNTPWHHEVVELTRTLKDELMKLRLGNPDVPEYDLACEHKHSCSVLLARVDQFAEGRRNPVTGVRQWRTWIDYEKFHELAQRHAQDPSFTFSVVDYTAPTPAWALFGAKEEGFDPTDRRHRKQTKYPKYTQFDAQGVPTHDEDHQEIPTDERERLRSIMEEKKRHIGDGSTVTELRGGEKEVLDASLMFRGLVVAK
jgi:tRNA wybutosine-synthesizing protein 1